MDSQTSLSPFGVDLRSLNPSPSALRALTSSRLTRRRPRRDSSSTSSSSSSSARSSIDSTTSQGSPSCVNRAVSQDQCALHRFIVWAAVQRNSCQKMTPAERLECPLLRCRKRFLNHELMLRHLYTCEQLCTGEYWCYDCGKAEKFTDGKCKRCLGHPGKRRRVMSIAKNFFSSLGQKSRNQHAPNFHMVGDDNERAKPPPSYDSILVQPQEVELSSASEILEIDSVELPLPLPSTGFSSSNSIENKPPASIGTCPQGSEPSMSVMPDLSFDWTLQNNLDVNEMPLGKVDRPSLSLHTYGLGQYRKQHKPATRTKHLSSSSSLRSNASTDTTSSYLVSPTSAFSAAWTNAETNITSPTSDGISPGGYLSRGCSNASRYSNCTMPLHTLISELPAEEIMLNQMPQTIPDDLGCQQLVSLETPNFPDPVIDKNADNINVAPDIQTVVHGTKNMESVYFFETNSLVGSAWDALKAHISSSLEKLHHISHNTLVGQLQKLSPQQIADTGLSTLKEIIEGRHPKSMVDTLCFVHVAYSLSLIVHEHDARNRSKQLFIQAYLYSNSFVPNEREAYLEVASEIWHPLDLSTMELDQLLLERYQACVSRSSSRKGKERVSPSPCAEPRQDTLVEAAKIFLDELEHTALPSKILESREVLGSKLWTKHLHDADNTAPLNPAFMMTVNAIARMLCQDFAFATGLVSKTKRFQKRIKSGSIRSVRRAELELIQAGRGCMSLQDYRDGYMPAVKEHFGPLYQQAVPGYVPRATYYAYGIELMQTIIAGICEKEAIKDAIQDPSRAGGEGDLDEFFRIITTGFDLDDPLDDLLMMSGDPLAMTEPLPDGPSSMEAGILPEHMTAFQNGSDDTANAILHLPITMPNTTTNGATESVQEPQPGIGQKVEVQANNCCEICGYRPKGHPQWFKGSMAKHKKLQHSTAPPKIYRCPYPGCTSQYKNRPDNLKQHQQDKGHFVGGEGERRPSKRKKREE